MTTIRTHAFTDVGLRRKRNEDAVLVGGWVCQTHTGVLAVMQFPVTMPLVCAVADGMGGHAGGHLASTLALTTLSGLTKGWAIGDDVAASIAYVNDQICSVGEDPELKSLGTTIAGLCVTADRMLAFNVGDSRIYSIEVGFLQQISTDDAVLDAQGRTSNRVTQALGQPTPIDSHVIEFPLVDGAYLICSDGVSGVISPAELRAAVLNTDMMACSYAIIESARDNGAEDNFSFLLVEVTDVPIPDAEPHVLEESDGQR